MAFPTPRTATLALLLCAPTLTLADAITDQIGVAQEVYESGDLRKTVQELQYAIAQIQEQLNLANTKLMPEPLAGWSAEAAQSQSGGLAALGGGTTVSRSYGNDRGETVDIQIIADSPMLQAMTMMISNPMLMSMSPDTRMYRYKGHSGMIKQDASTGSWDLSILIRSRILVQVNGQGLKDKQVVEDYLKAIDLDAVEEAFAG